MENVEPNDRETHDSELNAFMCRLDKYVKYNSFVQYLNIISLRSNLYSFDMKRTMFSKVFRRLRFGKARLDSGFFDCTEEISILIYNAFIMVQFRAFSKQKSRIQDVAMAELKKIDQSLPAFMSDRHYASTNQHARDCNWKFINLMLKLRCAYRALTRYRNGMGHTILMLIIDQCKIGRGFNCDEHREAFEKCLLFAHRHRMLNSIAPDEEFFLNRPCEMTIINCIIRVRNLLALKMVLGMPGSRQSVRFSDRAGRSIFLHAVVDDWVEGMDAMLENTMAKQIIDRDAVLHFAVANAKPEMFRKLLEWVPVELVTSKKTVAVGEDQVYLNEVTIAEAAAGSSNLANLEVLFSSKYAGHFLSTPQSCSCISTLWGDFNTTRYIMHKENDYLQSLGDSAKDLRRWTSFHTIAEVHQNFTTHEVAVIFLCLTHNVNTKKQLLTLEPLCGESWLHVGIRNNCNVINKGLWYLPDAVIEKLLCTQDIKGRTPLHLCAIHGNHDFAKRIVSYMRLTAWGVAAILLRDKEGKTFMEYVMKGTSLMMITYVFEGKRMEVKQALMEAKNPDGDSLFHVAALHETLSFSKLNVLHRSLIKLFPSSGVAFNEDVIRISFTRNVSGRTWLHEAAVSGNLQTLKFWMRCVKGTLAKGMLRGMYGLAHIKDFDGRNFIELAMLHRKFDFFTHILSRDLSGYLPLEALWSDCSCHLMSVLLVLCSETHEKVVNMLTSDRCPDYLTRLMNSPVNNPV